MKKKGQKKEPIKRIIAVPPWVDDHPGEVLLGWRIPSSGSVWQWKLGEKKMTNKQLELCCIPLCSWLQRKKLYLLLKKVIGTKWWDCAESDPFKSLCRL